MPEWLIWGGVVWFILAIMGRRGCSWRGPRLHRVGDRRSVGRARTAARLPGRRAPSRVAPAPPKETAEERIRRRFVEGRITLDQYEAELWEELRPKGSGG